MNITCKRCGGLGRTASGKLIRCDQCGAQLEHRLAAKSPDIDRKNQGPSIQPDERTVPPSGFYQSLDDIFPKISGYEIAREIGSGGMGRVFEAREIDSGRKVALKVLPNPFAHHEPQMLERFKQEGRLAAKISHPRSTFIYEAGFSGHRPFIAMELMPGRTLQDEVKESGTLSVQRAVDASLDIIDGLIAAHQLGVVHRDVKPSNCFVAADGRVKIGDFGLSKSLALDAELTRVGTFMGTPSFSSPEQVRGENIDKRSDIYSAGATMYDLLAGRPPFVGDPVSVTAQIVSNEPESLRALNPQVPKGLEDIIFRAMAKDPMVRFQDLDAMRTVLLPFASRGTSLAQIGRRVAAFMVDYGSLQLLLSLLAIVVIAIGGLLGLFNGIETPENGMTSFLMVYSFWIGVANWLGGVLLFGVCDGVWGATPGKRLMSLRVVNERNERPGLWRGLLRSFVIPGAFGVPLLTTFVIRFFRTPEEVMESGTMFTSWIPDMLPFCLLGLLCLVAMRESKGMRGIHEWLSGSRVLHLTVGRKRKIHAITPLPFQNLETPFHLGRFKIVGALPQNRDGEGIYLGWDDVLDRKVLIFCDRTRSATEIVGFQTNRATRNRWLQGGTHEGIRWDAFEYFGGVPFSFVANRTKNLQWSDVKNAIFDLTRELNAAVQDGSLPKNLSFDNFLINPEGSGRLIDLPVNITGVAPTKRTTIDDERSDEVRANAFVRDILDWCLLHMMTPQSAMTLIDEFRRKNDDLQTLSWVRDALDEENRRLSQMTWDSRLGALAFSAGIEWTVVQGVTSLLSWSVLSYVGYFPIWKTIWCWVAALVVVYIIGWLSKGGPAFRLMAVEIRKRNGRQAPAWLCGLRTVLSWAGICASATFLTFVIEVGSNSIRHESTAKSDDAGLTSSNENGVVNSEEGSGSLSREKAVKVLILFFAMLVGLAVSIAGAIVSVLSPERGIQDYLLGTMLVPK